MIGPEGPDFHEPSEPIEPMDLETDGEPLHDDPDSVDDVMADYKMEGELESPALIEFMAEAVRERLRDYTWDGMDKFDEEILLELCERLQIGLDLDEEVMLGHEALFAIEDIGFSIEADNYKAHALERVPTLEDIEEAALKSEDISAFQKTATHEAYIRLSSFIKDPILTLPDMMARRKALFEEQNDLRSRRPATFEEYEQKEERLKQIAEETAEVESWIEALTSVREIRMRRERAFRRMHWLTKQDYLKDEIINFLDDAKRQNITVDFDTFAGYIGGRYAPDQVIIRNHNNGGETTEAEVETKDVYIKGLIDMMLEKHLEQMANQAGKTANDRLNDAVMLRRLVQAKAICVNVFQNDITDNIYAETPVSSSQQGLLDLVRRKLFLEGDISVMDNFISFLPGSNLRRADSEELEVPLEDKLSGRTMREVFEEIDTIIEQHPALEEKDISVLVRLAEEDAISKKQRTVLAIKALTILQKMAYKNKHSVRHLLVED